MSLALAGVLPVSALNIGLAGSLPALQVKIDKLTVDLSNFGVAVLAQVQAGVNLPSISLPALTASIAAHLATLATLLDPTKWVAASASANVSLSAQLGLVDAKLQVVADIAAKIQAGLAAPGLSLWTYSGAASRFGLRLAEQTEDGWGGIQPNQSVLGIVVATEDFDSWGQFSLGFNTGSTSKTQGRTDRANLVYVGTLGGGEVNTGVLAISKLIGLILLELQGLKAAIDAQINVSLGLNLPSLGSLQAGVGATLPSVVLNNLINVKVDLQAAIGSITAQINALIALIASISAQLSADGLALWTYTGPASGFGSGLRQAIAAGVPGIRGTGNPDAVAYGVAVATALPNAWASFGQIFKVAA